MQRAEAELNLLFISGHEIYDQCQCERARAKISLCLRVCVCGKPCAYVCVCELALILSLCMENLLRAHVEQINDAAAGKRDGTTCRAAAVVAPVVAPVVVPATLLSISTHTGTHTPAEE